ncbi:MAG: pre-peptidase C-terminal domain-containing protein [Phycisphaeraceae bacterium]|nr:pre-peptidase C-terminal domain-containing protein [Phycisphaeraceae bacterium]
MTRILAATVLTAVVGSASAQTVWVDFGGTGGAATTPQGAITPLTAGFYPGLGAGQTAALRQSVFTNLVNKYAGWGLNFVQANPGGAFHHLVIGDTGTNEQGALGIADEIDFRNKRAANTVSIVGRQHNPPVNPVYTLPQVANMLATTAAHELGHVLGLNHNDVVSTFVGAGGGGAGQAAVQANEVMTAVRTFNGANEFGWKTFGAYSQQKLHISTAGINVQDETGAAGFVLPAAADPARAGDAGGTVATGTPLAFDAFRRTTVLGTLNNDVDVFTFNAAAGTRVTVEAFSQILTDTDGAGPLLGRIANAINPVISILNGAGAVIQAQQYSPATNFDGNFAGDFGSDAMIFQFAIPAAGQYAVQVAGGADSVGQYELLVLVPAPGSLALAGLGGVLAIRRRRA